MTKEELYAHPGWEWCTFEGARKQVLLIGLTTTFREKLEWLEEAENLSLLFQINRQRRAAEEAEGKTEAGS
jgi:hypothetical protein